MKERPILFTGAMVRALLNGSKTQTRRIYKNRKHPDAGCDMAASEMVREAQHVIHRSCPYGQPGERLWVRETFQPFYAEGVEYPNANWETGSGYAPTYPATDGIREFVDPDDNISDRCWPSIHMPRWASRILLEITAVRIERLQNISRGDAMDEGCPFPNMAQGDDPRKWYADLWSSINGAASWALNPWVWVVEFKRIDEVK